MFKNQHVMVIHKLRKWGITMNMFYKIMSITALLTVSVALPFTSYAQSIPDGLDEILSKKYSPRISILKEETRPERGKLSYKKANLGPYIYKSRITVLGGASRLGKPEKHIKKYCEESQSGIFKQVMTIGELAQSRSVAMVINDNGKQYSLTSDELFYLTRTFEDLGGEIKDTDGWNRDHLNSFVRLSEKGKLGVFQCNEASGNILWSIAMIPDRFLEIETQHSANSANYKKNVSIMPLDAETIETHRGALESIEKVKEIFADEKQQDAIELENFRATANVGTDTSCGLIIEKRGTLVEVDLKTTHARSSGKDTAWLKKENLFPDEVGQQCNLK